MPAPKEKPGLNRIPVYTMDQLSDLFKQSGGNQEMVMAHIDDAKEYLNALYSFDRLLIEQYMQKHNIPVPRDDIEFWKLVHATILKRHSSPKDYKQYSKDWLISNGFTALAQKYDNQEKI